MQEPLSKSNGTQNKYFTSSDSHHGISRQTVWHIWQFVNNYTTVAISKRYASTVTRLQSQIICCYCTSLILFACNTSHACCICFMLLCVAASVWYATPDLLLRATNKVTSWACLHLHSLLRWQSKTPHQHIKSNVFWHSTWHSLWPAFYQALYLTSLLTFYLASFTRSWGPAVPTELWSSQLRFGSAQIGARWSSRMRSGSV
jgi:hypothetical protein